MSDGGSPPPMAHDATIGAGANREPRPGVLLLALVAIIATAYVGALGAGYVWDDHDLIEQQPLVTHLAAPQRYLLQKFWANPLNREADAFYRPVTTLTFALDYVRGSGAPFSFHLTNLLLHLLAAVLVFALARRLGATPSASFLGAALFGLAPRLTESVAWISGRTDLLAVVSCLGALLLFLRAQASRRVCWAAGLCLLVGLLSKETAIALVPVLFFWARRGPAAETDGRERLRAWIPVALALLVYAALRTAASWGSPGTSDRTGAALNWRERGLTAVEGVGRYLFMLLDPFQPRVRLGVPGVPSWRFVAVGVLALLLCAAVLVALYRRREWIVLGLVAGALTSLALTLHLIPIASGVVVADRYLYFTLAVLAVCGALALSRLQGRPKAAAHGLAALLALGFAPVTYARAGLWADEEHFWRTAVEQGSPQDGLPAAELGVLYLGRLRVDEALTLFRQSAAADEAALRERGVRFTSFDLGSNAALCEQLLGQYPEAIQLFTREMQQHPGVLRNRYNLAMTYARSGDFENARGLLRSTAERDGLARKLLSEIDTAQDRLSRAASLPAPARTVAEAQAWDALGSLANAQSRWREVLSTSTTPLDELRAAARFFARKGTLPDGVHALELLRAHGDVELASELESVLRERYGAVRG